MTDEDEQFSMPEEAPPPGRSMTGAAQDLSSLFGDEAGRDPGRMAIRPGPGGAEPAANARAAADLASEVAELTSMITGLEFRLTDAVERIHAVDRHLATTFNRLQEIFDRMPEEPGTPEVAGALRELGEEVAGAYRSLGERLASLEERLGRPETEPGRMARVESTMRSALERLTALEGRAEAVLSEARSGRRALDELSDRLGTRGGPQADTPPATAEPSAAPSDESARSQEPADDPALHALLGRVLEPDLPAPHTEPGEAAPQAESRPAESPVEFWSSRHGGGTESRG